MTYLRLANLIILVLALANDVQTYKIAIFVPDVCNSQIIWNYRLGEALQKAGHQVTLIRMELVPLKKAKIPLLEGIEEWQFYGYTDPSKALNVTDVVSNIFKVLPLYSSGFKKLMTLLGGMFVNGCEQFVQNKELLQRLRDAKFDLAFADMGGLCSTGLIHYAKIPTWIWMNNAPLADFIAYFVGVHSPSSYVPPILGAFSDQMSFSERVQSFIIWSVFPLVFKRFVAGRQTEMFRKYVDPNFPDLADIAAKCPLVMVNSDEMYAVPRPILHKVVYIGGLGMNQEAAKPLTGEFKEIADKTSNIIVFSFGSIANATLMPQPWKDAFLESFRKFPDVEFIMRYEIDDLKDRLSSNVHTFKWLPQSDILHLSKTRALISHGGYNSMQEAINSATPLIPVPLFGDQPGNARIIEKHHLGIVLDKTKMSEQLVTDAINKILEDDSYAKSVQRMRDMIRKKPFKADELVVRWTEFVAEFKDMSHLTPRGVELNFIKYYCIDVVAFLFGAALLLLFATYKFLRCLLSLCYRRLFRQKKKKE